MLEGDQWKNGDKPMATPEDMRRFKTLGSRILMDGSAFNRPLEVTVINLTDDGEYAKVSLGNSGMFMFGEQGEWVRTRDCQILAILQIRQLPRQVKPKKGAPNFYEFIDDDEPDDVG